MEQIYLLCSNCQSKNKNILQIRLFFVNYRVVNLEEKIIFRNDLIRFQYGIFY